MFSDELKEFTMRAHQGLEKKLVAQIKNIASVDDYIDLLMLMYGFYVPIQEKIQPYIAESGLRKDGTAGREAASILADIEYFTDRVPSGLPVCEKLPVIDSFTAALGCLYVTEGSTLGGQHISRMIAKKLSVDGREGFTFFNAYGEETQQMWNDFKSRLNGEFSDREKLRIKTAAESAFSTFNEWINSYASATNQ